ncbi:MAG: PEP-CTERM sorting domain-containing protein [Bryobacterales bacterium]|nr:PEP-CTERM sorting domain-containing protein [Bryobacterales bacterium]
MRRIPTYLVLLLSAAASLPASVLLTGASGTLTVPAVTGPGSPGPGVPATMSGTGPFTGVWSAPANPAWWGTFGSSGPFPGAGGATGTSAVDFTTLNIGYLPSSTYIRLSDLDSNEQLQLSAYDLSNNLITTQDWLLDLVYLGGTNPADFVPAYMPTWTWSAGLYSFSGEASPGNPNLLYVLQTARDLSRIDVFRGNTNFSVTFASGDVPEPGTMALLGIGLAAVGLRHRRRA